MSLANRCVDGFVHEGEAKGEIKDIQTISTYFSYPADRSTHNAILIFTDAMGHKFINSQLIADKFAASGYFVVMPDLFRGDGISLNQPEDFGFMEWLNIHQQQDIDSVIEIVIREMRDSLGCKRIGGVGYCLGSKNVCRFLKPGVLNAGFIAHPATVTVSKIQGIERPLSIAASARDPLFSPANREEIEHTLAQSKVPYQINLISEVASSFYSRGDLSQPAQKFAKEQAQNQAVQWFKYHLQE